MVRALDLKSGGRGSKSLCDHDFLAGVVSRNTLDQLFGHACFELMNDIFLSCTLGGFLKISGPKIEALKCGFYLFSSLSNSILLELICRCIGVSDTFMR